MLCLISQLSSVGYRTPWNNQTVKKFSDEMIIGALDGDSIPETPRSPVNTATTCMQKFSYSRKMVCSSDALLLHFVGVVQN